MKLKFEGVTKKGVGKNKRPTIIDNLSFELNKGEHLSFLSTDENKRLQLIRLILGATLPFSGKISRYGSISTPVGESAIFHSEMTIRENIHFICELYGKNSKVVSEDVSTYLDHAINLKIKSKLLNLVEKRKIAMALSLFLDLDIYIIRNDISHPDEAFKNKFESDFMALLDRSATVITVSTNIKLVKKMFNRSIVIENDGRSIEYPTLEESITRYREINTHKES